MHSYILKAKIAYSKKKSFEISQEPNPTWATWWWYASGATADCCKSVFPTAYHRQHQQEGLCLLTFSSFSPTTCWNRKVSRRGKKELEKIPELTLAVHSHSCSHLISQRLISHLMQHYTTPPPKKEEGWIRPRRGTGLDTLELLISYSPFLDLIPWYRSTWTSPVI